MCAYVVRCNRVITNMRDSDTARVERHTPHPIPDTHAHAYTVALSRLAQTAWQSVRSLTARARKQWHSLAHPHPRHVRVVRFYLVVTNSTHKAADNTMGRDGKRKDTSSTKHTCAR